MKNEKDIKESVRRYAEADRDYQKYKNTLTSGDLHIKTTRDEFLRLFEEEFNENDPIKKIAERVMYRLEGN